MSIQNPLVSWGFSGFLLCIVLFGSFPGKVSTQEVILDSIQIFTTHEWFSTKPTVYFQCKGENKTVLPDVMKKDVLYGFKGEESWQPLTELRGTKCKRCGFYEEDSIMASDVFDEWEFCPSDFTAEGKYTHFKEKELNVTFHCHGCSHNSSTSNPESGSQREEKSKIHPAIVALIIVVVSGTVLLGVLVGYKYWQKKRRQQEQARFLKLFEDGDELEDEFGLNNTL